MSKTKSLDRSENPLLADWTAPFGAPPLDRIKPEHFSPAFDEAMAMHRTEIAAIAGDPAMPTFENTVAALERSGRALTRRLPVFHRRARAGVWPAC